MALLERDSIWVRAAASASLASILVTGIGLITGVIAARMLGAEGRGELATFIVWSGVLVAIINLPVADAMLLITGSRAPAPAVVQSAFGLSVQLFVFGLFPILAIMSVLVDYYGVVSASVALSYCVILLASNLLASVYRGYFQIFSMFHSIQFFLVMQPLVYVLLLLVIFFQFPGWHHVDHVVSAQAISLLVVLLTRLFVFPVWKLNHIKFFKKSNVLSFAAPIHAQNLLRLLSGQADRLAMVMIATMLEIGVFVVAFSIASLGYVVIVSVIRTIALPYLLSGSRVSGPEHGKEILIVTSLAATLSCIVTAVVAPTVVTIVFGDEFSGAAQLVPSLAFALLLSAPRESIVEILKRHQHNRLLLSANAFYLIVNVGSSISLYSLGFGISSFVISLALANVLTLMLMFIPARRFELV